MIHVSNLNDLIEAGATFGCIYADPPWIYGNQRTRGATSDHYDGLTIEQLKELPVDSLAAENAHLHLWTTNAFLKDSFSIMESWGFTYKSVFVWVKPQMGMGNYWRVSHEYLMFGIKGKPPFNSHSIKSWGEYPRGKHSAKPEEIRHKIELVSGGPYLEMFGRKLTENWTVWGNQIEPSLFDLAND